MSVIIVLCEEACPVHQELHCLLEKDHAMPHKGKMVFARERDSDSIVIEWRPVAVEFPPITRRCRFCGWAEEACHRPCPQAGDHLHSIVDVE